MGSEPAAKRPRVSSASGFSADTDLQVVVEDEVFHVHSLVLMLVSPVFKNMLCGNLVESQEGKITLHEKDKEEFRVFLTAIMPASTFELTAANVEFLVRWTDEYQVEGLKTKCEEFLMTEEPASVASLEFASKFHLERLQKRCSEEIKRDVKKYMDELIRLGPKLSAEVLEELWPCLCQAAAVDPSEMPPVEQVRNMWPFVVNSIKSGRDELVELHKELRTWPSSMAYLLPASHQANAKASAWLQRKLDGLKIT